MGPRLRCPWLLLGGLFVACAPQASRHAIQWDARDQIWLAEASQVRLRAAQSRVFDTMDRRRTLEAVVVTLQDLGFQVAVLDEVLGVVSGTRFVRRSDELRGYDPYYSLYDDESLIAFIQTYRTWGPFRHRDDLVRLTVTVRERNSRQLIVRASAQFRLRPVEEPEVYQKFFTTLEQSLFLEAQLAGE